MLEPAQLVRLYWPIRELTFILFIKQLTPWNHVEDLGSLVITNSLLTILNNINESSSFFDSKNEYALDTSNILYIFNKLDKSNLSANNATNRDNKRSIYSYNSEN